MNEREKELLCRLMKRVETACFDAGAMTGLSTLERDQRLARVYFRNAQMHLERAVRARCRILALLNPDSDRATIRAAQVMMLANADQAAAETRDCAVKAGLA